MSDNPKSGDAMSDEKIKVTKLDAAKRQVRTAIKLWFMEEDPVSIHTLASAAHEIIHTLFKLRGLSDLLFDSDLINDEYRSDWGRRIKADATFFKHAQRDPQAEREFNPRVNEYLLLFSLSGLSRMGESLGNTETTFLTWLGAHVVALSDEIAERGGASYLHYHSRVRICYGLTVSVAKVRDTSP